MVSFWPWRSDDTSPASFEKALSTLSAKIAKSQSQLDNFRQRSRRVKALWTLYTTFVYLLCAIILALVVGLEYWGALEYSALAGSPLLIYLVRSGITYYYAFRIDGAIQRLEEQQRERTKTIDRLKSATKYNSTQQLLEKYGGGSPQPSPKPEPKERRTPKQKGQEPLQRTNIVPPTTINSPRNQPMVPEYPPQPLTPNNSLNRLLISDPNSAVSSSQPGPPEFAPNAFSALPVYDHNSESNSDGKWYDRILDLLLGEDETSPKNRIVLICHNCRLVNGQAPPAIKRLQDIGQWRCISCGGWNGVEDEDVKVIKEMKKMAEDKTCDQPVAEDSDKGNIGGQDQPNDSEEP